MSDARESLRESRQALGEVFRNRNLRRLNLAFAGSVIGDWAYGVAASVYAYTHGGATAVGALGVARFVSMAVLSPFAALLADKFDRKRVMIASDSVRVVLVLAAALAISRRTYAKIRQNLFWAFVYNLIGLPLAAFGLLNPVLAGAAMALSSVSVVANALLLKRWKANLSEDKQRISVRPPRPAAYRPR